MCGTPTKGGFEPCESVNLKDVPFLPDIDDVCHRLQEALIPHSAYTHSTHTCTKFTLTATGVLLADYVQSSRENFCKLCLELGAFLFAVLHNIIGQVEESELAARFGYRQNQREALTRRSCTRGVVKAPTLLTFLKFLVPDGRDSLGVLSVVNGPLSHELNVLQRRVQVLKLLLQRLLREAVRSPCVRRRHFIF